MSRVANLTRSWPALAGAGAGLVQVALGAGGVTAADATALERIVGVALASSGAAWMLWAIGTLRRGRPVLAKIGAAGAVLAIVLLAAGLVVAPARTSVFATAAAIALVSVAGAWCAASLRTTRVRRTGRTGVTGILVGAIGIAALVTPALSATEAGQLADHSMHGGTESSTPADPHDH